MAKHKQGKLFLAALGFTFLAALFVAGRFPYFFFYLLLLSVAVPYWRLKRSLAGLTGQITVSDRTREVGQAFTVTYRIINSEKGHFPYLELANTLEEFTEDTRYIYVRPGGVKEVTKKIVCRRRGVYSLQALTVKTGDPFGFFQLEKPLANGGEVKVYPRIKPFTEIVLPTYQQLGERTRKNAVFEDYSRLEKLRPWQTGDSLKKIHWKQTAKQNKIIVKDFAKTAEANLTIFIDMHRESYLHDRKHQLEDLAVELAASIIFYRLQENHQLQLFTGPGQSSPLVGKKLADYEALLDHIIRLAPKAKGSFFRSLRTQSYFLRPNTSIYLITPSLTLTDADVLLYLKRKGFSLVFFYLSRGHLHAEIDKILGRLREAGISVKIIYTEKEDE
ncbi:MAG: DUF58 domain-containing protein [Firmicutes bacterium]|nr:DUF58 domain-containing protein [Bacillota bacterium]